MQTCVSGRHAGGLAVFASHHVSKHASVILCLVHATECLQNDVPEFQSRGAQSVVC